MVSWPTDDIAFEHFHIMITSCPCCNTVARSLSLERHQFGMLVQNLLNYSYFSSLLSLLFSNIFIWKHICGVSYKILYLFSAILCSKLNYPISLLYVLLYFFGLPSAVPHFFIKTLHYEFWITKSQKIS